ncbi:hypothetical protein [Serratia sp. (in: enterobacteria)]|uniref:hypothetical protein n=1 Tax=Serratia sp. (in: enterobacteria) TaxID=616 RepID=UPI00398A1C7A
MSWKDTAITNPGTSVKYGADDLEMVMRMFNGVTTGVNTVTIKSTSKWGFWDNVLYFRNQADSKNTTIRGQSNVPATDVTLALPPTTTNDTLTAIGITNIFSASQRFDAGAILKQQSTPANPASTFHHFYAASNGHLIRRNSSGVEVDYDTLIAGLPSGLTKQIQYNNAGVFAAEAGFEYDAAVNEATIPGLTVTENLILNNTISPPQITASQSNYNPTGLATATTLRLTSDSSRDIHGIVAQPSGTVLFIHNVGSFNIVLKDESASSTTTNRFALPGDLTLIPDNSAMIKYDGTTGRWRLVASDTVPVGVAALASSNTFTQDQTIEENQEQLLRIRRLSNAVSDDIAFAFQALDSGSNVTTYAEVESRISDATDTIETGTLRFNVRMANIFNCVGEFDANGKFRCGGLNRRVILDETGLSSSRTYTFPNVTTLLAGVSTPNVFIEEQQIEETNALILKLYRKSTATFQGSEIWFDHNNTTPAQVNSGNIRMELEDNTAGSEDAVFSVATKRAGVLNKNLMINGWGVLRVGPDESNAGGVTRNVSRSNAGTVISNTTSEGTLFTQNILGNTMGANGILHLRLTGFLRQDQATSTIYTIRVKWGGTTQYQEDTQTIAQQSNWLPYILEIYLYNMNATNIQGMVGSWKVNDGASATTGIGDAGDDEGMINAVIAGTSANLNKDTTANQTFAVTIQHSVASSLVQTYVDMSWLEINPS